MSTLEYALIGIACIVIIGLGIYAGQLLFKLKQQVHRQQKQRSKYYQNTTESIQLIAKAVTQGQCELSEGAIRLCVLLERIGEDDFTEQYPATHDLYQRIKHMPTHEARKSLSKKERRMMDIERSQYEQELSTKILEEAVQLQSFSYGTQ